MDLPPSSETELVDPDEAEILASFRVFPTEDDLPCDDGEPLETPRKQNTESSRRSSSEPCIGVASGTWVVYDLLREFIFAPKCSLITP
jgi:hypothetical protein